MNWLVFWHAAHTLAAGVWLGGLVFTSAVVSPAFKRLNWTPVERVAVRSEVGRQYTKVARVNLLLLFVTALLDWLPQHIPSLAWAELLLIVAVILLAELHGRVYAPRLARAAREQNADERRKLLRFSISISMLNLAASAAIVVLASLRMP